MKPCATSCVCGNRPYVTGPGSGRRSVLSCCVTGGPTPAGRPGGRNTSSGLPTRASLFPAHHAVLQEMMLAETQCRERVQRLEAGDRGRVARLVRWPRPWSACRRCGGQADLRRDIYGRDRRCAPVSNPRQLMAYLGLVPSERSTGDAPVAAASQAPATPGSGVSWRKAPGPIAIPPGSERRNTSNTPPAGGGTRHRLEGTGATYETLPRPDRTR